MQTYNQVKECFLQVDHESGKQNNQSPSTTKTGNVPDMDEISTEFLFCIPHRHV